MSELDFIEKCEDELNELDDFIVHMNNMFEKIRLEQYHIIKLYYAKQHLEQNEKIQNEHEIINYNDKHYVVIKLKHLNKTKLTVIDFDDFDKIKYIKWCYMSNGYIFTRVYINWKLEFPIYLHNLIMNQIKFTSDKTGKSVDHINRIPLDNRKENLRLINQTDQNFNQNRKARTVRLPDNCNIKSIEIPRSVSYSKARGIGGEYFEVWLPNFNNQDLRWSSSRDKTLSLKFKLEQTKKYLRYLQNKYPEEINKRHIETEYNDNEIKVIESYNAIIKLSKFYDQTMEIKYNQINYLKEDLTNLTETEIKLLNNLNFDITNNNRKIKSKLPENCGITSDMIPKYCYYAPNKINKKNHVINEHFVIDKHPKLEKRGWTTNCTTNYTINQKFEQLLNKLKEIESS
ncbi:HNH endonuclease [Klosneuvirus KNV1]|uniref:HNH endonuclease n=1 Tax=Klosneuvirus KNV1 TaxID=1977640 RepID=A0A1V0SHG6_9VIRU|nr:HNH endonuclease [Klosneuvirus KNV1]